MNFKLPLLYGAIGLILGLVNVKIGSMMCGDVIPYQKAACEAYFRGSRYQIQALEGFALFYVVSFFIILVIRIIKK